MKILMFINGLYPEAIDGIEVLGAELARQLAPTPGIPFSKESKMCLRGH